MTLVPHTGQSPLAALRPFLSVTSVPSNSRLALHFTQYASYLAMPASFTPQSSRPPGGGLLGTMLPSPRHGCKYLSHAVWPWPRAPSTRVEPAPRALG